MSLNNDNDEEELIVPYYARFAEKEAVEMLESFGISDRDDQQLAMRVSAYIVKNNSPVIDVEDLLLEIVQWADANNYVRFRHLQNLKRSFEQLAHKFSERKIIRLVSGENGIKRVVFIEPQVIQLNSVYKKMQEDPLVPFPDESELSLAVATHQLKQVEGEALTRKILEETTSEKKILRVNFTENGSYLLVPSSHALHLYRFSIMKLRAVLFPHIQRSRIIDEVVREMQAIMPDKKTTPEKIQRVFQGQENEVPLYYVNLMTRLTVQIKKDRDQKHQKMLIQAARIIHSLKMEEETLEKERAETERKERAMAALIGIMRERGGIWSRHDIYPFAESKEEPWSQVTEGFNAADFRLLVSEGIDRYSKVRRDEAGDVIIPDLFKFNVDNQEIFVHRERYYDEFEKQRQEIASELMQRFLVRWGNSMRRGKMLPEMQYNDFFYKDVDKYINQRFPVFTAFLTYPELLHESVLLNPDADAIMRRFKKHVFRESEEIAFRAAHSVLGLERREVLRRVRSVLPIWVRIPLLRWILSLFNRSAMVERESEVEESSSESTGNSTGGTTGKEKAKKILRENVESVMQTMLGGFGMDNRLETLEGKWNIKIGKARFEMKSMIDDSIRKRAAKLYAMHSKLGRVDPGRLQKDIAALANNVTDKTGDDVREKDAFREYAMLTALQALKDRSY